MATYGRYQKAEVGEVLITEGERAGSLLCGGGRQARDHAPWPAGHEVPLSVAEVGECLGEVSLLDPSATSVRSRSSKACHVVEHEPGRFCGSYLSEHAGGSSALLMGMASCLSHRLRQANKLIAKHRVVPVEILPAGRERAITAENTPVQVGFFDRLKKSMGSGRQEGQDLDRDQIIAAGGGVRLALCTSVRAPKPGDRASFDCSPVMTADWGL